MNTAITQEEQKKTPPLIKGSSTYKLIVPENVEEKIRYLIQKYPSTEWSGVLFTSHQGSFEDNNLVITCHDIYPMDLGTTGWTEFKMNEDVAAYMAENIELFDCDLQLVHSHHTMGAFFSGQDVRMIAQEGNDTNCFVSLVVDTQGTYVAIVTRKIKTDKEITIKELNSSYEFFGEGPVDSAIKEGSEVHIFNSSVIEYFDLEVERHTVECPPKGFLSYLDDRFDEILSKKRSIVSSLGNFSDWLHYKKTEDTQLSLFGEDEIPSVKKDHSSEWTPDEKAIKQAVVNILSCSLITNAEKFDIKQWIKRHLHNVHTRLFESPKSMAFSSWCEFIITFILDNFDYDEIAFDEQFEDAYHIVAQAIYDELFQYIEDSPYIKEYCDELLTYIF